MNSVILASATHRKIRWMSDGIDTQVKVQMVNKCKALINLGCYIREGNPHEKGIGELRKKREGEVKEFCSP